MQFYMFFQCAQDGFRVLNRLFSCEISLTSIRSPTIASAVEDQEPLSKA